MNTVDWSAVLEPDAPPVTALAMPLKAARRALAQPGTAHADVVVRTVDARDCATTRDFHRAIATALDFPPGLVSWNVIEEYLYDLTWLPDAAGYVLALLNAERFAAAESASGLEILDKIFTGIADDATTNPYPMAPRRLICQYAPGERADFAAVLGRYGIDWPPTPTVDT
ncbi:MAG TPA: barstar family protein [Ilumatobacter sp.]|nr:barstar family protein [Ilumatobacter sp.]